MAMHVSLQLNASTPSAASFTSHRHTCPHPRHIAPRPQVNPAEEMLARATRCRLSGERLAPPCVADELGSLFNKEALVHALLNKTLPPALAHITSLKAVTTLKLDAIPSRASSHASAGPGPGSSRSNGAGNGVSSSCDLAVFQCPVTGMEMNGRFGFVIHKPTGVVLSERALREVCVVTAATPTSAGCICAQWYHPRTSSGWQLCAPRGLWLSSAPLTPPHFVALSRLARCRCRPLLRSCSEASGRLRTCSPSTHRGRSWRSARRRSRQPWQRSGRARQPGKQRRQPARQQLLVQQRMGWLQWRAANVDCRRRRRQWWRTAAAALPRSSSCRRGRPLRCMPAYFLRESRSRRRLIARAPVLAGGWVELDGCLVGAGALCVVGRAPAVKFCREIAWHTVCVLSFSGLRARARQTGKHSDP